MTGSTVLLISVSLFFIGFIGVLKQYSVVRALISLETTILASVFNFCYPLLDDGFFMALIFVILGGITISIIYAIYTIQIKEDNSKILDEE